MFNLPIDTIIHGNTLSVLNTLPSESIDCCICSPPYWSLRDYGIEGQLGLEPTFNEYITNLQTIFDEVYRVLKREGTLWVDLGDTYASKPLGKSSNSGFKNVGGWRASEAAREAIAASGAIDKTTRGVPTKSLCNIPHRFAISMTDNGWIERNCIIWHKPSCMPSSAKDRFTVDYEFVFMFSKNRKYYFEQQFEDNKIIQKGWLNSNRINAPTYHEGPDNMRDGLNPIKGKIKGTTALAGITNGRNKRTVWCINPQSFKDAHFAVFPEKLVEPMIKAGCPPTICDNCNKPYLPNYETKKGDVVETYTGEATKDYNGAMAQNPSDTKRRVLESMRTQKTRIGYIPQCDCDSTTHAGIVLDPFSGSGTTCLVARKLGRHYIGIDLNESYCDMSRRRISNIL